MGSGDDASSNAEIAALRERLGGQIPSWRHVEAEPACTEYYKGKGKWLDHVVATSGDDGTWRACRERYRLLRRR